LSQPGIVSGYPLVLLTRPDCGLCEDMLAGLAAFGERDHLPPLAQLDVDSDPELMRRYGLKIPVLLLDGALVCSQQLDADELRRLLRR